MTSATRKLCFTGDISMTIVRRFVAGNSRICGTYSRPRLEERSSRITTLYKQQVRGGQLVRTISRSVEPLIPPPLFQALTRRYIGTENSFHSIADETLESMQDALDELFDSQTLIEFEASLASGVLTLKLPPHGTWVINKQTPNRQIWVRKRNASVCGSVNANTRSSCSGRVPYRVRNASSTMIRTNCGSLQSQD
jgi:iron donor protein CyaY